jgi:hypothetical protein
MLPSSARFEKVEKKNLFLCNVFLKIKKKEVKDAPKQRQVFLVLKKSQKAMIKIWC